MEAAGYSGTPLPRKLGLRDGQRVAFCGLPEGLQHLTAAAAFARVERGAWRDLPSGPYDLIHLFVTLAADLVVALPALTARLARDGMLWVSWPKKAARLPTDITEDVIRDHALRGVLVDVKVCAVDAVWSGLKLVIRKEWRAAHTEDAA